VNAVLRKGSVQQDVTALHAKQQQTEAGCRKGHGSTSIILDYPTPFRCIMAARGAKMARGSRLTANRRTSSISPKQKTKKHSKDGNKEETNDDAVDAWSLMLCHAKESAAAARDRVHWTGSNRTRYQASRMHIRATHKHTEGHLTRKANFGTVIKFVLPVLAARYLGFTARSGPRRMSCKRNIRSWVGPAIAQRRQNPSAICKNHEQIHVHMLL
jgi:hypothetical protein